MNHQRIGRAKQRIDQQGVMLVEVLIALVIFMIGALGLMGYVGRSMGDSVEARARVQAALMAQKYYARLEGRITTTARGADAATYSAAVSDVAPTLCEEWVTDTLKASGTGLPNSSASCSVVTSGEAVAVRLEIVWRVKAASGSDPSSAVSHKFVTQKSIV